MGIPSINRTDIFIVKCPEPNTTKNSPFRHIGVVTLFSVSNIMYFVFSLADG